MTQTAYNRDNILTEEERVQSGRKCYSLLEPYTGDFNDWELGFITNLSDQLDNGQCSERQLKVLRDMTEKYAQ